jgi:hypothetical protein
MLNHHASARSLARVALAAALAATLMSGCGSDDDATQSQSVSTAAAATSPSTSAAPAPAAAAPAAKPTTEPAAADCPIKASELSERLGVKLHATAPALSTKVSCTFGPKIDCPCGPTEYAEVIIVVAAGLTQTVSAQRAVYVKGARSPSNRSKLIDRPDLGKDAFVVKVEGQRGRAATFPSSDGPAVVSVALGLQNAANRAHAAQDARAANRAISLVVKRMS